MEQTTKSRTRFLGTYFDPDAVLKVARLAGVVAWVMLGYYIYTAIISSGQFLLMTTSGAMSFTGLTIFDRLSMVTSPLSQLAPGVLYFILLKVAQQVLLILMDLEDSSRRAVRN